MRNEQSAGASTSQLEKRDDNSNRSGSSSSRSSNSRSSSDDDDEKGTVAEKFRRGEDLPSDLDLGSHDSGDTEGSNNDNDDEDDGDWNMMGAALEREFLGME